VGQHPAAFRAVCWTEPQPGERSPEYLEIETKHGLVVVIAPSTGAAFANPPLPQEVTPDSRRVQTDLTEPVAAAFNDRPVFTAIVPVSAEGTFAGWRFHLSTGTVLTLTPASVVPVTATERD